VNRHERRAHSGPGIWSRYQHAVSARAHAQPPHDDKVRGLKTLDDPLGDDRRDDVGRLRLFQGAVVRQRERQGRNKMLPINRKELFGGFALVVDHPRTYRGDENKSRIPATLNLTLTIRYLLSGS
jgi:hypothetical protein